MAPTLNEQLKEMKLGDHLCLVYETEEEQMSAIVPYMKQGLERMEACVYITDDRTLAEVKSALVRGGIDVEEEMERGALTFATKREAYLRSGSFEPEAMIEFLRNAVESALQEGFTGYRITGEMTWALGDECGCERLIEYETKLNRYFPGSKATGICQYNRKRFRAEIIRDVLRTHPIAIVGSEVCHNLFYENPDLIAGESSPTDRVDWMISQLKRFHTVENGLKESIRARDEFLSVASHELKTPLTTLNLQIQMLQRTVESASDTPVGSEGVTKRLDAAARQTKRLAALVDMILDVSRAQTEQMSLETELTEISQMVSEVVRRFTFEAAQSGSSLELHGVTPFSTAVDRIRLDQVLSNLLSNAIKYGGGKPIDISLIKNDESFQIKVRDHGIGISPEDQSRIFSRFERAVPIQNFGGLGLGLFVAHEIIRAHGGKIEVDSRLHQGAEFRVDIPLHFQEVIA